MGNESKPCNICETPLHVLTWVETGTADHDPLDCKRKTEAADQIEALLGAADYHSTRDGHVYYCGGCCEISEPAR